MGNRFAISGTKGGISAYVLVFGHFQTSIEVLNFDLGLVPRYCTYTEPGLFNKPLHISKADTKISIAESSSSKGERGRVSFHSLVENTIQTTLNQRSFIHLYLAMHSAIL